MYDTPKYLPLNCIIKIEALKLSVKSTALDEGCKQTVTDYLIKRAKVFENYIKINETGMPMDDRK